MLPLTFRDVWRIEGKVLEFDPNDPDQGTYNLSERKLNTAKSKAPQLLSAKGIDYRELENLLKNQEWRSADELTARLMLKVANLEKEGWLDTEHIETFPCEDLRTIDQLWVYYSNSKFGFSIQKKLWLECGGEIGKYDYEVWKKFAAKVGWYHPQNDYWRTYTEFMNDIKIAENALPSSLPCRFVCQSLFGIWAMYFDFGGDFGVDYSCTMYALFSRRDL